MTCYHPNTAYRSRKRKADGKYIIQFGNSTDLDMQKIFLPCGRCIGCRLKYSRTWASRIMQEAQLHKQNAFITLTYDDAHLPPNSFLVKKDFQKFMKRYRAKYAHLKIRYFMCGEYGDKLGRPHYHACIFGHDFEDKVFYKKNALGNDLYTSESLDKIWKNGYCITGALEYDSAAYVARYVCKKVNGKLAFNAYAHHTDLETGEIVMRPSEYANMSRNSGIAKDWYKRYKTDVYPHDYFVSNGHKQKPPRYFDDQLSKEDPELYARIKALRESQFNVYDPELKTKRLLAKEEFKMQQVKRLTRKL